MEYRYEERPMADPIEVKRLKAEIRALRLRLRDANRSAERNSWIAYRRLDRVQVLETAIRAALDDEEFDYFNVAEKLRSVLEAK